MQSCGVELDEFQVFDRSPCLPGQGHPFSRGLGRIGRVGVEVTAATGGQHNGARPDPVQQRAIEYLNSTAAAVFNPELTHTYATAVHQPSALLNPLPQHVHQGTTCLVLHMQHPMVTVGGLQSGGQASIAIAIKGHPDLKQPLDTLRCLVNQQPHRIAITQTRTRFQRVVRMARGAVVGSSHRGDTSLGPTARRAATGVPVQQQNA